MQHGVGQGESISSELVISPLEYTFNQLNWKLWNNSRRLQNKQLAIRGWAHYSTQRKRKKYKENYRKYGFDHKHVQNENQKKRKKEKYDSPIVFGRPKYILQKTKQDIYLNEDKNITAMWFSELWPLE